MNKENFIETYIEIETQTFVRSAKTNRLNEFINSIKSINFNLSFKETIECINHLQQLKIPLRQPIFVNVFYPTLTSEIEKNNIEAIKSLIQLFDYYGNYQNLTDDIKFSIWKLLEQGLQISPTDIELLRLYEEKKRDYFEYTLHELPTGVLYSAHGATIEQCEDLLNQVNKYKEVCEQLNVDNEELITDCKFYYSAYKNYLLRNKNFKGFEDFLDKNKSKNNGT